MSTYTPSLGLELITPGSQAGLWGNTTNNTFTLIDQAVTGVTPISFASASGTTYTLTDFNGAEDEARSAVLNITGSASGSNTVVIPNKQKTYLVRNSTGQDVVFQTPSPSTSYTVGAGYSILIFCDGNNGVFTGIASPGVGTLSVNAGGTGNTTFTAGFIKSTGGTNALTSSSTVNLATETTGTLTVAKGGTGVTSFTAGAVLVGNGTGNLATVTGSIAGYVLTWNGSTWVAAASSTAPVTSVFGRTGVITADSTDYSSYYLGLNATAYNSDRLGNVLAANYVTSSSGTAFNSDRLGGSTAASYATLSGTQTFTGKKTFNGSLLSTTYEMAAFVSMYYNSASAVVAISNAGANYVFYTTGTATAVNWSSTSDARIKENVKPIYNGLETIAKLNPVQYSFIHEKKDKPNHYGLIAQELETVLPDMVVESTMEQFGVKDVKAISYTELIPILIKAVQELKSEVDALKAAK